LVAFIPNVFVAILVLFLGTLAATFVADIVRGFTAGTTIGNANIFANIARFAIIGFAALIALEQLPCILILGEVPHGYKPGVLRRGWIIGLLQDRE
jgi:hypothetical protein